jgi:hypothetical protein
VSGSCLCRSEGGIELSCPKKKETAHLPRQFQMKRPQRSKDDAVPMPGALVTDFALVDAFVASRPFSVYSLGSIGLVVPEVGTRHQRFVSCWGWSQAIIWSEGDRS